MARTQESLTAWVTLAHGDLPLENIEDHVEIEGNTAWLSFTLDGIRYKWDAIVSDDWVDSTILEKLAQLLAGRQKNRRFTYIDLGGQDCLIGCSTAVERNCLTKDTGINVQWLKAL